MKFVLKTLSAMCLALAMTAVAGMPAAFAQSRVYNWSGWYVGANVGYGFGENDITIAPVSPGSFTRFGFVQPALGVSPHGILGGVQFGANWQTGNIVYGFEADFAYSDIRATVVGPLIHPVFLFQTTDSQTLDWFGTLRARAGFAPTDRTLVYLTGGLAYGRASVWTYSLSLLRNACGNTIDFCAEGYSKQWKAGWTLGGGFEYAVAPNWSAKFEYLYYDLGTIANAMVDNLQPDPDEFRGAAAIRGNIVRAGINYRFGGL